MVAKELVDYFTEFNIIKAVGVEDTTDRLNSLLTTVVLFLCVAIVSAKQYVLNPIICFAGSSLSAKNFMEYVTSWCWVHGTVPLNKNGSMFEKNNFDQLDATNRIVYYQWVPFIMSLQALIFFLPRLIWSGICRNMAGTDMENIMVLSYEAAHTDSAKRSKLVNTLCGSLELVLYDKRCNSNSWFHRLLRRLTIWRSSDNGDEFSGKIGNLIRFKYLCLKMVYLLNLFGQLWLIQHFLGFSDFTFGVRVLHSLMSGKDWSYTNWFPRITYCNVKNISVLGGDQRYIAQCVLPLNMLNEKIYIFLWFWLVLLFIWTLFNLLVWIFRILCQPSQDFFIRRMLRMVEMRGYSQQIDENASLSKEEEEETNYLMKVTSHPTRVNKYVWRLFAHRYLRSDGIFLLRIILCNVGSLVVCDIVHHLWKTYHEKKMAEQDEQRYADNMTVRLGKPFTLNRRKTPIDDEKIDSPNGSSIGSSASTKGPYSLYPTAPALASLRRGSSPIPLPVKV